VTGLRVVDASAFPKIPGFFPALPLYIISEKAADVVIQDASLDASQGGILRRISASFSLDRVSLWIYDLLFHFLRLRFLSLVTS
jgi:hypothetical protein